MGLLIASFNPRIVAAPYGKVSNPCGHMLGWADGVLVTSSVAVGANSSGQARPIFPAFSFVNLKRLIIAPSKRVLLFLTTRIIAGS
jgi:hypothetical protein